MEELSQGFVIVNRKPIIIRDTNLNQLMETNYKKHLVIFGLKNNNILEEIYYF